nr:hypothetical protein [uncultured Butyrivibrio sp.]
MASEIIVGAKKTRQIIALREYCVDQQGIMIVCSLPIEGGCFLLNQKSYN